MYGLPLAAGALARPTNAISAMIVTTYGIIEIIFTEIILLCVASDFTPLQIPKIKHPFKAPSGENLPKITAAIAMKP